MKAPKDIERFEDGKIAAARLIHLALEYIIFTKGKVQWTITLRHWNDDWLDKTKKDDSASPVRCVRGTFSNKSAERKP